MDKASPRASQEKHSFPTSWTAALKAEGADLDYILEDLSGWAENG